MRRAVICLPTVVLAGTCCAQQFQDETASRFPTQSYYSNQASVCDIDRDGDLDVIFADGQGYSSQGVSLRPRIYVNNGSGFFTDETTARSGGILGWFRGVEFGDVDRDGDEDMVLANDFYKQPVLMMNDGDGFFTYGSNRLPSAPLSSARAQFGDVDNDGDLDLVFCHSGTSSRFGSNGIPRLYLNDGTGFFSDVTATQTPNEIIRDQQDCIFGDIDGDLDLDLHISSRSSTDGGSRLYINDGEGTFTRLDSGLPTDYTTYSYDLGDIDGDGDLDLLGANSWSSNREMLLRNDHSGTTWTNISSGISPNPTSDDNDTKFLDFDMDGDLDFVVATLGSSQERFYRNNGNNTFTQASNMASSITDSSLDVVIADVDDDGRFDMITAQGESGNFQNRIYMNTGPQDTIAPTIPHLEQVNPVDGQTSFIVRAIVYDQHTSDRGFIPESMELLYAVSDGAEQAVDMAWSGNSLWRAVLVDIPACTTVEYHVRAVDRAGNSMSGATQSFESLGSCGSPGDLNGDGAVDGADIGLFLLAWGGRGQADFNGDGVVNGQDFGALLAWWTG